MKILVTGAKGFVGQNLVASLMNIKENKDRTRDVVIDEIYEYDLGDEDRLDESCRECDFVFNLAGVNRPKDLSEFMEGNFGFASTLLDTLKKYDNKCGVMLSSSIQATLLGRYAGSDYGKSKLAGEEVFTKLNCSVMLFSFALKSATFFSNLPLLPKFKLQDLSLTNSKIVTFEFPPVVCVVLETVLFVVFVAVLLLFPLLSVANT